MTLLFIYSQDFFEKYGICNFLFSHILGKKLSGDRKRAR